MFKRYRRGDGAIESKLLNAAADALDGNTLVRPGAASARTQVLLRNDTGADLCAAMNVVTIATAAQAPGMAQSGVGSAVAPVNGQPIAFLPACRGGAVAEAIVAGIVRVQVDVTDAAHTHAAPQAGNTAKLISAASGPAEILWKASGTGTIWAVIRLGGAGGGAAAGTLDDPYLMPSGEDATPSDLSWLRDEPLFPAKKGLGTKVMQRIYWSGIPGEAVIAFYRWHRFDDAGALREVGPEFAAPMFWTGSCDSSIPAPLVSLAQGSQTNAASLAFSWVGATGYTGGTGIFRYRIGTETWTESATNAVTVDAPATEGTYVFQVQEKYMTDHWGATGTYTFIIDRTAPAAPTFSTTTTVTNNPRPTWAWVSNAQGDWLPGNYHLFEVARSGDWSGTYTQYTNNAHTPSTNLPEGTYTLTVREFDPAGNYSGSIAHTITIDLTPPAAPVVSLDGMTSPIQRPTYTSVPVTFLWDPGDATGNGTFRYCTNSVYPWTEWTETTDRYVTITRSTTATGFTMTIEVQERDAAGNWSASGTQSLVVEIG